MIELNLNKFQSLSILKQAEKKRFGGKKQKIENRKINIFTVEIDREKATNITQREMT